MTKFLLLCMLANSIITSCQTKKNIFTYDKKEYILTEEEKEYDISDYSLNIFFEKYFTNNDVKIFINGERVFNQNLTTKRVLGLAGYFQIKVSPKSLKINIDGDEIELDSAKFKGYKYLYINITEIGEKKFNFSNKPVTYQ